MAVLAKITKALVLGLIFPIIGCSSSDSTGPANPPNTSSGEESLVLADQSVGGGFPHKADYLFPPHRNSETRAIVLLHGGGGVKHNLAYSLRIKKADQPGYDADPSSPNGYDQNFLIENNVALVFVQGESLPEKQNSWTWSNSLMTSGQDDRGMLEHLAEQLRSSYGFSKVYLMGHSMGGAMANEMWCKSPLTFDGYGSMAGPMSVNTRASCNPLVKQPYIHVTGLFDRIIQLTEETSSGALIDHTRDQELKLDSVTRLLGAGAWVHPAPEFKNELVSYPWRTQLMCGEVAAIAVRVPDSSSWESKTQTNCEGRISLIQIRDADHCIGTQGTTYKCEVPLNKAGDTALLNNFVDFFRAN